MFKKKQKNIFAVKKRNRRRNIVFALAMLLIMAVVGVLVVYPMMRPVNYSVTVEAGDGYVLASRFVKNPGKSGVAVEWGQDGEPDWNLPGEYPVVVSYEGKEYAATIIVEDTKAPVGEAQPVTRFVDDSQALEPLDFVKTYEDVTKVTAEFEREPDLTAVGTQNVVVILTDESGNQLTLESTLTITDDQEPPIIYGQTNRSTYLGIVIPLDDGIAVVDDRDETPQIQVDDSAVDFNTQGVYPVIYRATDHAGNVTEINGSLTVGPVRSNAIHIDTLNEAIDGLLAEILTEGMSDEEKCRAVYDWSKTKMLRSKNPSDKNAWTKEAYRAIRWTAGDSYTYSAFFHGCMLRMGFEDMMVKGDKGLYWNLVNLGDGWLHVDPNRFSGGETPVFLLTDEELKVCSQQLDGQYDFDETLYPKTK